MKRPGDRMMWMVGMVVFGGQVGAGIATGGFWGGVLTTTGASALLVLVDALRG